MLLLHATFQVPALLGNRLFFINATLIVIFARGVVNKLVVLVMLVKQVVLVVGRARMRMYIRARVRVDISRARWRASICQ
jgi:sorbitol-specific phosphotransferase system component IIC